MTEGVRTKLQILEKMEDISSLLSVNNDRLAIIVDWQCEGSVGFVTEVRNKCIFGKKTHLQAL